MYFRIITLFVFLFSIISCTKQTQTIADSLGDTTGKIVSTTVDSIMTDSVVKEVDSSQPSVFVRNMAKLNEMEEVSEIYEGDGRVIQAVFKKDAEGNAVVVLSEKGNDLFWLYETDRKDESAMYKIKETKTEFFVEGNTATLKENGKTFNLIAE